MSTQTKLVPTKEQVYAVVGDCWMLFKREYPKWETIDYWRTANNPLKPWIDLESKYAELARDGAPGASVFPFAQAMIVSYTKMITRAWEEHYHNVFGAQIDAEEAQQG